jgi:hypothetical protein
MIIVILAGLLMHCFERANNCEYEAVGEETD